MTFKDKLSFTHHSVGVATLNAFDDLRGAGARVAGLSGRLRVAAVGGMTTVVAVGLAVGGAAAATCGDQGATNPIVNLFKSATMLVITIAGIGSILMGVVGACLIMFSAGHEGRAKKGMLIVKNCVLALAIVGGIYLVRYVVTTFMASTNSAFQATDKGSGLDTCPTDLLNGSGNLGTPSK
jgi:hypothetical protein